jgi:hypothetical protein
MFPGQLESIAEGITHKSYAVLTQLSKFSTNRKLAILMWLHKSNIIKA